MGKARFDVISVSPLYMRRSQLAIFFSVCFVVAGLCPAVGHNRLIRKDRLRIHSLHIEFVVQSVHRVLAITFDEDTQHFEIVLFLYTILNERACEEEE